MLSKSKGLLLSHQQVRQIEAVEEVFGAGEIITEEEWIAMGMLDGLKAAGFKPEANTDGEWVPYKGVYKCKLATARPETDEKTGNKYAQIGWKAEEKLTGDEIRSSKFDDFRKRYFVEGEKADDNLKKLINDLFTAGYQIDVSSDEAFWNSLAAAVGTVGYIRAYGWTPEDSDRTIQLFVVQKQGVAEKKRTAASTPF